MRTPGLGRSVGQKIVLGAETFETCAGSSELPHGWSEEDAARTQGADLQIFLVCAR